MNLLKNRLLYLTLLLFILTPVLQHGQDMENLDRVINTLGDIPFERRTLLADYGGFGSSILVRGGIAEPEKAALTFVVAVPLNAEFAVNTALSIVKKLPLGGGASILVAFLGDEQNSLPDDMGGISNKGLRDLLTVADMPENWVLCYIDIDAAPDNLTILHGINGYVAPLEIIKPLPKIFKSRGIPWSFRIRYNEIYKLGLVKGPDALFVAWDSEINGFVLSGTPRRKTFDNVPLRKFIPSVNAISAEDLADCLLDYARDMHTQVIKGDRHYSYFTPPWGSAFFLDAGITVALLLVIVGLAFLFFLVYSSRYNANLLFNIRLFFKFIWFFLILLPLMVISVKIAGYLYSLILGVLNPDIFNAPGSLNYAGAGLTALLAFLLFILPSPALDYIRFPRKTRFYEVSAVIFISIGLFSAAFLDFSYVPVFLWAFIFVFIGAFIDNAAVVFICIVMIPLIAFDALFNIIETDSNIIAELVISSSWATLENWLAALIIALFTLPLFLLIKRVSILLQKSKIRDPDVKFYHRKRLIVFTASIVIVIAAMVLQILKIPEKTPYDRRVLIAGGGSGMELELNSITFQDSIIITARLAAGGIPVRFDVSIESVNGGILMPVYSAPVPFDRDDDGKKIIFALGEHPPNPLTMEIVVPQNFEGLLSASAIYNSWDPAVDPGARPESDDYVLVVSRKTDLATN